MLTVTVTGKDDELQHFINELGAHFPFQTLQEEVLTEQGLVQTTIQLELHRKVCTQVKLALAGGPEVVMDLLDCKVVTLEDGVTLIHGRNYDIFSGRKVPLEKTNGESKK
ncbi:hypothetical protein [Hazenella coriacea]|uniref:Uncharacterized protein n=1 Tax=Hazenella coriacea TaxID=1179467 RepID=A0A4V2UUX6_9BACL|nr:hypothetical protein [Hazenella coriacea]TCS93487.1 hypothetical protein EDD58_107135 [Hazenella coriacea]